MEIEKTRETSWKIQLKKNHENIELTSVEISGDVQIIRLALLKEDQSIIVEMSKEEFSETLRKRISYLKKNNENIQLHIHLSKERKFLDTNLQNQKFQATTVSIALRSLKVNL